MIVPTQRQFVADWKLCLTTLDAVSENINLNYCPLQIDFANFPKIVIHIFSAILQIVIRIWNFSQLQTILLNQCTIILSLNPSKKVEQYPNQTATDEIYFLLISFQLKCFIRWLREIFVLNYAFWMRLNAYDWWLAPSLISILH